MSDHLDRTKPVRPGEELDLPKLAAYLAGTLPTFTPPLVVEQFPSGHSNLTYLLRDGGGRELVLRRPPFGAKIRTAHDMGREHHILSALRAHDTFVAAPRPLAYCDDPAVLGAPFYLMERISGLVLRGSRPAAAVAMSPELRGDVARALVDTLAALHAVDYRAAGLEHLGKPEGYVRRQVEGWTERYRRAQTDEVRAIDAAAAWLAGHLPPEVGAVLIHNDFKHDNVVLDPDAPTRVRAVLDWEMATLGDPLMDLGTTLGYWLDPDDPEPHQALPFGPTLLPGNPGRAEVAARYAERSGRDVGDLLFYYVFALFKIAVIAQQIYRRYVDGHTRDERFGAMIVGVQVLGATAERALERGRISALG